MSTRNFKVVMLITIDCLRYDYSERYMRFTNAFFKRYGNIFANVYTHGVGTPAAFPAILTSTYPLMYSMYPNLGRVRRTLAEVIKSLGFYTIGIASNPYLSRYFGYDRGFDLYFDYVPAKLLERLLLFTKTASFVKLPVSKYTQLLSPYIRGYILVSLIEYLLNKLLKHSPTKRIFVWLHFMDLHAPLTPALTLFAKRNITLKEFSYSTLFTPLHVKLNMQHGISDKFVKKLYVRALVEVDHYVEILIEILERLKVLEESLVIITSDHGEELLENGIYGHPPIHSEHTLHVPLYAYPRIVDSSTYINSLKSLIDLAPSILNVLGFDNLLRTLPWYGESVLFSNVGRNFVIAETGHTSMSNDIKDAYLKFSIVNSNNIVTYKPFGNIIIVRNKDDNSIKVLCRIPECPSEVNQCIGIIRKHMKFEKKTQLLERVRKLKQHLKVH